VPSVSEILQAYAAERGRGSRSGLSFIPPLIGLIRPANMHGSLNTSSSEQSTQGLVALEFSRIEFCQLWVTIQADLIDTIDLLGKRSCQGEIYDYARITLKLPSTPEGLLYAGLMHQYLEATRSEHFDTGDDLSELLDIVTRILGGDVGCTFILGQCGNYNRCNEGFRVLREFKNNPSRDTVERLARYIYASSMNERCMKAIVEYNGVAEFAKFIALIAAILAA
jgi:hypothetical protein